MKVLQGAFPDAAFEIEKPVFEIGTAQGPCLPDFLIRARRGCDVATFVVEVMGFERPDYLRGKEVTHPRMETLGNAVHDARRRVRPAGRWFDGGGAQGDGDDSDGA